MEFKPNFEIFSLTYVFGALIITLLVYFSKKNKTKFKRELCASLFSGPNTYPYFGNSLGFMSHPENISTILSFYKQKYGSRYRLWIGQKLSIVLADATDVENALMGNKFLHKGADFHDLFGRVFKNGTFTAEGANWRKSRRILQRPLKANLLQNYADIINDESRKIVTKLASKAKTSEIFDISDYIALAAFNVICRALYNLKNLVTEEDLKNFREGVGRFFIESIALMFYPKLMKKMKMKIDENWINKLINAAETAHRLVMREGKFNANKNEDDDESNDEFINFLRKNEFSDEDKKAEIVTYSVGGSETITFILSMTCLMLAIHSDIQDKVYEEQKHIFGDSDSDRDATEDDIRQMDYLEQVLKEVMRLFPMVPVLFRTAKDDVNLGDFTLPSDTEIIINVPDLHKNPKYFPNPETFDPERFSKEKCQELPKGCYLPFVIGPRNCIGKAFSMYEMKILCSAIVRKYRIHPEMKREDIKLGYAYVSRSAEGYKISISERNK